MQALLERDQLWQQSGNVAAYDAPQGIVVDTEISMYQAVTGGDNEPPWYLRIGLANLIRNMGSGLAK